MESKLKLNVLKLSDKVSLIQLVERGNCKKCEIVNALNTLLLTNRKIKF